MKTMWYKLGFWGCLITLSNFKFFIYKYDEEVVVSNC